MTSCQACGKLIASGTAEQLCRACREAARAAGAPAAGAADEAPTQDTGSALAYDDDLCVRCRRHPPLDDSEFCLACHLELVASLGDAAEEVFRTPPAPPEPPISSAASLMSDLDRKRDRTATSHINVVGGVRIK